MGAVMADEFERFGIVARDNFQRGIAVIGSARSTSAPLTTAATAFFSSDLEIEAATCAARNPGFNLALGAIGERQRDHVILLLTPAHACG